LNVKELARRLQVSINVRELLDPTRAPEDRKLLAENPLMITITRTKRNAVEAWGCSALAVFKIEPSDSKRLVRRGI